MYVTDCLIGVEYVVQGIPMVYLGVREGSRLFAFKEGVVVMPETEEVYTIHDIMGDRWVIYHDALGTNVQVYPFNNDIWVKVEDLR